MINSRPVSPSAIESELNTLWREITEARQQANPSAKPLSRTRLFNLLVFVPASTVTPQVEETLLALINRQPFRAIVMVADSQSKEATLEASLALPESAGEMRGEVITFTARGVSVLDLPGTVLPLLITDAPTFLWWQTGNPFTHPIFDSLAQAVDRVIVDSLTFTTPLAHLADVAQATHDARFPAIITDLGWALLSPWRALVAQIFDPQATRPYLNNIERVKIAYYQGSPVLAWLLGGWLASRLQWTPTHQSAELLRCAGGQRIEFEAVVDEEGTFAPGYFAGLTLRARDGALFEIGRLPYACAAVHLVVGERESERVLPVRYETTTEWVGRELNRLTRAPLFEAVVALLTQPRSATRGPAEPV